MNQNKNQKKFDSLQIAQDILDFEKIVIWKNGRLGVQEWDNFRLYGQQETKKILAEFHDMLNIAKRCKMVTDPFLQKLMTIVLICRDNESNHQSV